MRIAVLGGGNGSFAAAGDLALAGHEVRLWRRDAVAVEAPDRRSASRIAHFERSTSRRKERSRRSDASPISSTRSGSRSGRRWSTAHRTSRSPTITPPPAPNGCTAAARTTA